MYLNSQWRVITIGDGDLSFSHALVKSRNIKQLVATVFDSKQILSDKYGEQHLKTLESEGITVLTGFDICKPESWGNVQLHSADLVIFQFPLRHSISKSPRIQSSRWLR